jgi:serine phosphatase RsbU (regulator of sigma subunit)
MQRARHSTTRKRSARLRWHTPGRDNHLVGVVLPVMVTIIVLGFDVLEGPESQYIGLVAAMPLLAASLTGPLRTGFVGLVVTVSAVLAGFLQETDAETLTATTQAQHVRVGFIALVSLVAVRVSVHRIRRLRQVRRLSAVADAAQQAILRPLPPVVGNVRCASTYVSATYQAQIGGDLVEVLDTRFGTRALVGDVRGKGMDAVRLAGLVLGSFREQAWTAPDLATLAGALDSAVRRAAGPEDFVTAALVEVHEDGTVDVVSCGHPAPFVTGGSLIGPAALIEVEPEPPLGLLESLPTATTFELDDNQRLVLVTDGLLEARRPKRWFDSRSGEFLPAATVLGRHLARGDLRHGLREVVGDVQRWSHGRLGDDMAVLALEHRGRVRMPAPRQQDAEQVFDVEKGSDLRHIA